MSTTETTMSTVLVVPPSSTVLLGPSSTVVLASSPPIQTQPPIVQISRFLFKSSSSAFQYAIWAVRIVASTFAVPISLSLRPVRYLFGPFFNFLTATFDILILTPYTLLVDLAHALYPFYAFITVACICGVLIGLTARLTVFGVQAYLWPTPATHSIPASASSSQKTTQSKVRKRVSIKEEHLE